MTVDLISELRALIGVPPAGLEFLEYVFVGFLLRYCGYWPLYQDFLLIFLVWSAANIISCIFRWIGGGL